MATARCTSSLNATVLARAPEVRRRTRTAGCGGAAKRLLHCYPGSLACTTSGAERGLASLELPRSLPRSRSPPWGLLQNFAGDRGVDLFCEVGRPICRKPDGHGYFGKPECSRHDTAKVGGRAAFLRGSPGFRVRCKRRTKTAVSCIARQSRDGHKLFRSHRTLSRPGFSKSTWVWQTSGLGCLRRDAQVQERRERSLRVCCSTGLVITTADYGAEGSSVWLEEEVQDFGLNEDVILANVPVQSKEEQEKLARTPAHPQALRWMFAAYTANCTAERTFRFAVPAVIGLLSNSLLPIAIISFAGQVGVFALGPIIGDLLDETPRLPALRILATMQVTSMVASACVTLYAFQSGASACATAGQLIRRPWFIFLTLAGVVERLAGIGSGVAYERDWVVQLAGPNRHIALAEANALLRRLDLGSEIFGPFSLGLVLSRFTPAVSLGIAATAVAAFLPLQLFFIHLTDKISRGALRRYSLEQRAREGTPPKRKSFLEALKNGWRLYLQQPVLPASIAYVMLFFNAVLSPGGLITSFLTTQGISPQVIGGFRGACALFGFAATFSSAWIIERVGLLNAGAFALSFQAACLALSVAVYIARPAGAASGAFMVGFLALIVLSRLGMWTYDVVDTQVFQTAIPESHSSVVSTTELSLCSLAELVMLGVAMAAEDPRNFGALAALSMASVVGAAVVYCRWISHPCVAKKELFGHGMEAERKVSNAA